MTTTVTVTGTGTPMATADRAGAGALVRYGDTHLQFDAGRATVTRLMAAGSSPADLTALFLTHYHSDHLVGLQDVVLTHWTMDVYDEFAPFELYAPNGHTMEFCERMLDIWHDDLAVRSLHNLREPKPKMNLSGFDAPTSPTEVWSNGDVRVLANAVRHEPIEDAVGYRIETPDGVVAISGDTIVCDEMAALAEGADVVVYEALRMDVIAARPPDKRYIMGYHADTRLIGKQVAELDVPMVMLTHMIPAPSTDAEKQLYIDEVREGGYEGEIIVCDDLDSVVLDNGSVKAVDQR
jgi:ribonuclease Z